METVTNAQYLSAVIGVVLPILVALVTKHADSPALKSTLLLAFSVVTSFLTEWLNAMNNSVDFVWQQALFGSVMTFVVGTATLFGLWRPTGVDAAAKNTLRKDTTAV